MIQIEKPEFCDTNEIAEALGIEHTAITFDGTFLNVDLPKKDELKAKEVVSSHVPSWRA